MRLGLATIFFTSVACEGTSLRTNRKLEVQHTHYYGAKQELESNFKNCKTFVDLHGKETTVTCESETQTATLVAIGTIDPQPNYLYVCKKLLGGSGETCYQDFYTMYLGPKNWIQNALSSDNGDTPADSST